MRYSVPTFSLFLISLLVACSQQGSSSTVKVNKAPAQGLSEHAFDQGYLQNLVEDARKAAEKNLIQYYDRDNTPTGERVNHAQTSGRYEWLGRQQIAVVDLSYSANPIQVMRVVGIEQNSLITISCISPYGEPLDLHNMESECGRTVKLQFQTHSD
ncbi:MAG: hypothetical protein AAES65_00700 [Candidatus Thiodiazotropha sp. (ex. Lucinoma kazani)]